MERWEKECYPMLLERPACLRVSWLGMLWPDWESSLDLTSRPQACEAACKQEGNMIRFVF